MNNQTALEKYRNVSVESGIASASAHQLVSMLMSGALEKITAAKVATHTGEVAKKGEYISKAIAIIDNLRASVDAQHGGEIAMNLTSLYDYIERRLIEANIASDTLLMDEVIGLITEIKLGWVAIPAAQRNG